ncbi:hypothetical protein PV10_08213 [Exophiala mesophila]|uniref:YCII-related domain-containing protein n=1 Tax=Exophiala mesophila TaxID=212818 RepID=A0A0D1Z1B7_EXOME|nr:uncharacterized protein PV10_08213 [Exophiala mesophila]KIV88537.1 hypothetical protein PV10_08213 [Exophiala mesophila]
MSFAIPTPPRRSILRLVPRTQLQSKPITTPHFLLRTSPAINIRMSSSATGTSKPLYEWVVQIPDLPGALDKRMAARPAHLANLKPLIDEGIVVFGGAQLSTQPKEGEAPAMMGSIMMMKAESEEKVREFIEKDAYTVGGAWDAKNAKIFPFRCAVRTAM